jgi:hypothetical protein
LRAIDNFGKIAHASRRNKNEKQISHKKNLLFGFMPELYFWLPYLIMSILKKLLSKFNGLHYKQEYLCLAKELFEKPLHVYLVSDNRTIKDITNNHLFTGYSPLVFTFPFYKEINFSHSENIEILFSHHEFEPNDIIDLKDALAAISFQKIHEQSTGNGLVFYYKGQIATHHFVSAFHQQIIQLQNRLYNKRPGNVYLAGNLLKQVQVAYSFPRIISLVTIKQNDRFNLFPTDLHGKIDDEYYIISLRHGGKAAQQVELAKNILVTEIDSSFYKTAYSLGKNHMQDLRSSGQFPFTDSLSEVLQLPLPRSAIYYRELELEQSFEHGIHRFFLFKIINKKQMLDKSSTLAHVHNVYATWRYNKGLPGNYLMR